VQFAKINENRRVVIVNAPPQIKNADNRLVSIEGGCVSGKIFYKNEK
jgi:hypothetical protein